MISCAEQSIQGEAGATFVDNLNGKCIESFQLAVCQRHVQIRDNHNASVTGGLLDERESERKGAGRKKQTRATAVGR